MIHRVIYVALTKEGNKVVTALDQPVMDLHKKLLGRLNQTELREVSRLLEKVREGLAHEE